MRVSTSKSEAMPLNDSIDCSSSIPTLTYVHELWVMTRKDKITDINGRNKFLLQGGRALP